MRFLITLTIAAVTLSVSAHQFVSGHWILASMLNGLIIAGIYTVGASQGREDAGGVP